MFKLTRALLAAWLVALSSAANADWTAKNASSTTVTFFAFTCFTTKICAAHVPVDSSGTELFTAGNPGYVNVTAATGLAQGSTTSGQTGSLVMGAVTTAAPSYTNAQTSPLSLTVAGGQRMDVSSVAGTALGAPANLGTSPGAVKAQSTNSSVCDATNCATVKAASTPPAYTDKALVTATRPASLYSFSVSNASDNHQNASSAAGIAYSIQALANGSQTGFNYIRLYDAAGSFNGCGSATGIIWRGMYTSPGIAITLAGSQGAAFTNGLAICVTGATGDTNATNATSLGSDVINISYK